MRQRDPREYVPVQQFRALDGGRGRAGRSVTVHVGGRGGVPASASAAALTVQAIAPAASGALTVFPTGSGRPNTTNLGFARGQHVTQAAVSRLAGGALTIANRSAGRTHVTVDVVGYYVGGTVDNSEPGLLHLLAVRPRGPTTPGPATTTCAAVPCERSRSATVCRPRVSAPSR